MAAVRQTPGPGDEEAPRGRRRFGGAEASGGRPAQRARLAASAAFWRGDDLAWEAFRHGRGLGWEGTLPFRMRVIESTWDVLFDSGDRIFVEGRTADEHPGGVR